MRKIRRIRIRTIRGGTILRPYVNKRKRLMLGKGKRIKNKEEVLFHN